MSGTWLFVHSRDVDLKGSNVGHQEGQTAPMEHLGGGESTLTSAAVPTSLSITKSSGKVSKKRRGDWPLSLPLYRRRSVDIPETQAGSSAAKEVWMYFYSTAHNSTVIHSLVMWCAGPHCKRGSWWISVLLCFSSGFPHGWTPQDWCWRRLDSEPPGCSHSPTHTRVRTRRQNSLRFMVFEWDQTAPSPNTRKHDEKENPANCRASGSRETTQILLKSGPTVYELHKKVQPCTLWKVVF